MKEKYKNIHELLRDTNSWPCDYSFKFIVPIGNLDQLMKHLDEQFKIDSKKSKNGNYISITAIGKFKNADDIINVYESVETIEGIIAL